MYLLIYTVHSTSCQYHRQWLYPPDLLQPILDSWHPTIHLVAHQGYIWFPKKKHNRYIRLKCSYEISAIIKVGLLFLTGGRIGSKIFILPIYMLFWKRNIFVRKRPGLRYSKKSFLNISGVLVRCSHVFGEIVLNCF